MAHQVTLTWVASTDTVDGYNIYRGAASGQETALLNTSGPVTVLTFVDTNPNEQDFYAVRSTKAGVESVNSNEVMVTLPVAPPTNLVAVAV